MKTKQHLRRGRRSEPAQTNYWQSYSDMMASLLMVFILIVAISIVSLNQYRARLAEQNEELLARQELLEKQNPLYARIFSLRREGYKLAEIHEIIGVPDWELYDILWPAVKDAVRRIYDHGC